MPNNPIFTTWLPLSAPTVNQQPSPPWQEPRRVKSGHAARAASGLFSPVSTDTRRIPFYQPLSAPVRRSALPTSEQQAFFYTGADPFPETVTEDRWHQSWSDPVRFTRLTEACRASGLSFVAGAEIPTEFIFEDKWHFAWSEPIVKLKAGLRTGDQQTLAFNETPFPSFSWYASLSDPVRLKIGLHPRHQEFFEYQPTPIIDIGWFAPFSEPKRFLRGQPQQPFFTLQPNPIISIEWFANLSEPKRPRIGQPPQEQSFFTLQPTPIIDIGWFNGLSEPKRFLKGLPAQEQPSFTLQPNPIAPIISIGWFAPFSEPRRFRKGGSPTEQLFAQFFPSPAPIISFGWFSPLSEPKRFRQRLLEGDQEFLTRGTFIPTIYTVRLDTVEQRDLFLGILSQFNFPLRAYVDIIENDPRKRGNLGIIENVAQSSILASIVEPETVPSTGAAVSLVAGARVAIIVF